MNYKCKMEECVGCGACSNICPKSCISMGVDKFGFLYPNINTAECINCNKCRSVCPIEREDLFHDNKHTSYYAAWAIPEYMNPNSTSGGIVSVLAQNFVNKEAFVCGACFDDQLYELRHYVINSREELDRLAGSKYLQSDSSAVMHTIKSLLEEKKELLFIGTPCQVAALRAFLQKDYDNLFTIDFFCHGVPSPLAWKKYVSYLENKYRAKLISYNFSAKKNGWGKIEQAAQFEPKRFFGEVGRFNTYHNWFGHHLSIRSSCFNCHYRSDNRVSDLTVGDFWKIESYYPEIPTRQGLSSVFTNTQKGKSLLSHALKLNQIQLREVSYESIWEKRKTGKNNFVIPDNRDEFLLDLAELNPADLVKKYPTTSVMSLFVSKIKSIFRGR